MSDDSVTRWIRGLQTDEDEALERLFAYYYEPVIQVVKRRLPGEVRRTADEEDVALHALHSFFRRAQAGRFPQLANRDDVWKLLVAIAQRKCMKQIARERALKRGGGTVRGDSAFDHGSSQDRGIERVAAHQPTADEVVEIEDCARHVLDFLGQLDSTLKSIAVWKSYGMTDRWIARELGVAPKTVERKVKRIRDRVRQWASPLD